MRRLTFVAGLICLSVALLLLVDDNARSEAAACGAPPPTTTPGPPTATRVPPTASPIIRPTIDLNGLPFAKAPGGLHAIAACQTRDQSRAMLNLLVELLDDWQLVPFDKGLPWMTVATFEDSSDSRRTIALAIYGDEPRADREGKAAQNVAGRFDGLSDPEASIATDGTLVWIRYQQRGYSYLTWGATGDARYFSISVTNRADIETMVDALARAAEHACYPDCQ